MPALPAVPGVVRVRLTGTNQGATFQHVMFLKYSGGAPDTGSLNSVAAQVGNAWNANLASLCNGSVALTLIECEDLSSAAGAFGSSSVVHSGTRVGTDLPVNVAMVVTWHVNFRWRGGHPRTYLPAAVTADITQGKTWVSSFQTAAQAAAAAFLTAMNAISVGGSSYFMVCVRYKSAHVFLTNPLVLPITAVSVHGRVDTQRRRLGKETA